MFRKLPEKDIQGRRSVSEPERDQDWPRLGMERVTGSAARPETHVKTRPAAATSKQVPPQTRQTARRWTER
jgi:hypothetical protein